MRPSQQTDDRAGAVLPVAGKPAVRRGRRVRVVQLTPNLGVGGAERMLADLVGALDRSRYDVEVLTFFAPTGTVIERALAEGGVPHHHLDKRLGFDPRVFVRLARRLSALRPDVVHTHRAVLQYALPWLAARSAPVVHTIHNVAEREVPRSGRIAHRIAYGLGVRPVAIGGVVAESFTRLYGRPPAAIVPNGIPVSRFAAGRADRHDLRRALGVTEGTVAFLCAARLDEQKNIAGLLRAFARVAAAAPAARLLVAGRGPHEAQLRALALELALGETVRFLGVRDDMPDVYGAADVFVLSSRWEGNPISVMEAHASGLPVVSTAVGGVPEIVEDGTTGLLAPPGDDEALSAAMIRLAHDGALRSSMAEAARRAARLRMDVSTMARSYERLYEEALAARDAGGRERP